MNVDAKKVLDEALRLPEGERADLAASLIDSLAQQVEGDAPASWDAEILRRLAELDRGTVKPVPWPEARRMILGMHNDPSGS